MVHFNVSHDYTEKNAEKNENELRVRNKKQQYLHELYTIR